MKQSLADLQDAQDQSALTRNTDNTDADTDADNATLVPMLPDPPTSLTPKGKVKRSRTGRKNNRDKVKRPVDELSHLHTANSLPFTADEFSGLDTPHQSTAYLGAKDYGQAYSFLEGRSYDEQFALLKEREYTFRDPDPRLVFPFPRKTSRVWLTRQS